jgi:protease-4
VSRERSKGIVGIFVLITVLFVVFMIFAFFTINSLKNTSDISAKAMRGDEDGPIAVITVEGAIMESKKTIQLLHAAEEEESIKAILVRIDSPGGAVAPTQEIYEEINKLETTEIEVNNLQRKSAVYLIGAVRSVLMMMLYFISKYTWLKSIND